MPPRFPGDRRTPPANPGAPQPSHVDERTRTMHGDPASRVVGELRRAQALARLVGTSPAFLRALEHLPTMARGDATVLVCGETGTGKELVARAIHYLGERAGFPFVPVNCGALPDTLLEAELFGHERGAFTDARERRAGLVAQADRGTLFLDEVDSLTPRAQVALLRLLQDRTLRPLGSGRETQVDVRFVAASNASLAEMVQRGAFRADLYYRLAVLTLTLPPLRERREDVLELAGHLLARNLPPERTLRFSPDACAALLAHSWPGNVRELENAVLRGIHLAPGEVVSASHLGLPGTPVIHLDDVPAAVGEAALAGAAHAGIAGMPPFQELKQQTIQAFERDYLVRAMARADGNVSHAARDAGKERREFGKLLKKYRVDPRDFIKRG
jgi:DNA-binding NtrC family response regulator